MQPSHTGRLAPISAVALAMAVFCGAFYVHLDRLPLPAAASAAAVTPRVTTEGAALATAVDGITTFHDRLEPNLWNGMDLAPSVRERALGFAATILGQLDAPGIELVDIVTLGSLASYEYDRHADFDVHIFVRPGTYAGDVTTLRKYVHQFNQVNAAKYAGLNFHGYPAEFLVYVAEPESQMAPGVGMYSLRSQSWLSRPTGSADRFDRSRIRADAARFIGAYNVLAAAYDTGGPGFDCGRLRALTTEMRSYREVGIRRDGIRSTENLTYRLLRRLNINMLATLRATETQCITVNASLH